MQLSRKTKYFAHLSILFIFVLQFIELTCQLLKLPFRFGGGGKMGGGGKKGGEGGKEGVGVEAVSTVPHQGPLLYKILFYIRNLQ